MRSLFLAPVLALALALPAAAGSPADTAYTLDFPTAPLKVKKGAAGTARVAVVPKPDAHVDPNAPISLTVTAGPGLELPKAKLGRPEAKATDGGGVAFEIPFAGKAAASETIKASLTFFICTAKLCERQKKELSLAVVVE